MKITAIRTRAFHLPLKERMVSATLTLTHRELVTLQMETDEGVTGVGWYCTPGVGALAAKTLIDHYLVPLLIGQDPRNHERIWNQLWHNCHYAGPGGLTTLALSAIDIALWDIKGKTAGEPLWRLLGGARASVGVYASAINLHLSKDALLKQVEGHLQQGYTAFKLKIGRADHEEDLDRCRAVRALIGPNCELLLDVNQKWKAGEAVQRLRALAEVSPGFIEEPLLSDDIAGHALVREQGGVPVAIGEQLGNKYQFWDYVRAGAVDYLQPCPWKVGGITEWMKIAAMAQSAGLVISSHAALELSQHLAAAIPNGSKIENIFGVSLYDLEASRAPLAISKGQIALPDTPGHGIVFDGPALDRHEVKAGARVEREATAHTGL